MENHNFLDYVKLNGKIKTEDNLTLYVSTVNKTNECRKTICECLNVEELQS